MGKDIFYVTVIWFFFFRGTFGKDIEWNKDRPNDLRFRSGDAARKPDSIMSHQLLLPLKGCFLLLETIASQMLVTRNESGI